MSTQNLRSILQLSVAFVLSLAPLNELRSESPPDKSETSVGPEIQQHVSRVVQARTALETKMGFHALFKHAGRDDLQTLKSGAHDGIALQIAWNDVLNRTFEIRKPGKGERGIKLNRRELNRFVGFVEGRLKVTVPAWWEKVVLSARAAKRPDLILDFVVEKHAPYHKTEFGPWAQVDTSVKKRGDNVDLRVGQETATIPGSIVKVIASYDELDETSLSALVHPKKLFIVLFSSMGESADSPILFCVERKSGNVLWKKNTSTNHEVVVYGGVYRFGERTGVHAATIIGQRDRVLLFGAEHSSVYVHGFSIADGRTLFRFSTDYYLPD